MSFQRANGLYIELRDALRAQIAPQALTDLNIRAPIASKDEASFIRLTAWCYALLYEAGRTSMPFLLAVERDDQIYDVHKKFMNLVSSLRAYLAHNLGFDDGHDLNIRKICSDWFLGSCGAVFPSTPNQWERCFNLLCDGICQLLMHCCDKLAYIATSDDKGLFIEQLRRRISRNWPAHEYDKIITDAAFRMGNTINARALREQHLSKWRAFAETIPDDQDVYNEVVRLIESVVYHHFKTRLPITTSELVSALGLEPGPKIGRAIELARRAFDDGITDKEKIILAIKGKI
jgi:hypothetical protein